MMIQCPNCTAVLTSRGFEEGARCLACCEPINLRECTLVDDRRKPVLRVPLDPPAGGIRSKY